MEKIPVKMKAAVLQKSYGSLDIIQTKVPEPDTAQVLVKVHACGICRTDLHIIDQELESKKLPLILGHEVVGEIIKCGHNAGLYSIGQRVGIPWLASTCGQCEFCLSDRENLCDFPQFTGYSHDGGFAEYIVADQNYCLPVPDSFSAIEVAPLLCAGLIGYRSYSMIPENAVSIGIFGFGAAAHIITQIAVFQNKKIYAFTRKGDKQAQSFALQLGCVWAGSSEEKPLSLLDAVLIFAPVGSLLVNALKITKKGAYIICGGIHMSDIPSFPYQLLWQEKTVKSVANLQRKDGIELMKLASLVPVKTRVNVFSLDQINDGIEKLRAGKMTGANVIKMI